MVRRCNQPLLVRQRPNLLNAWDDWTCSTMRVVSFRACCANNLPIYYSYCLVSLNFPTIIVPVTPIMASSALAPKSHTYSIATRFGYFLSHFVNQIIQKRDTCAIRSNPFGEDRAEISAWSLRFFSKVVVILLGSSLRAAWD